MHKFSYDWFGHVKHYWDMIVPTVRPKSILEIGSFEGRSTCYIIEECTKYNPIDLCCIDTWEGSVEHRNMSETISTIEDTFHRNISHSMNYRSNDVKFRKMKGTSATQLSKLLATGFGEYFDLVYIDGSHQAADVMLDACLSFQLTKLGGTIIFDDCWCWW